MAIEVFNRYEQKYIIDREIFEKVIKITDTHMILDQYNRDHNPYTIANIYYDTSDDYLVRKSLSKPEYKEKLRLRAYGVPDNNTKVFLEIKKKYRGIVNKRRTVLTLSEACGFLNSTIPPKPKDYMNLQVVKEIEYFLQVYSLQPKVYLAYDRIAYFEKDNNDLRISFDQNIRTRRYDLDLSKGDYGENLLNGEVYLMEIKTSKAMPLWLTDMLTRYNIKKQSFSKYGTEFKKAI